MVALTTPSNRDGHRRSNWEVVTAALIMVVILVVLDVGVIRQPMLVFSCLPFLLFLFWALVPMSASHLYWYLGGCLVLALLNLDPRFLGLAYPALPMTVLACVQKLAGGRS
jgi:hypothetical protein